MPRTPKTVKRDRGPIPEFANLEEEAAFWDSHDFTEYQDGFKPVRLRVAKNLSEGITIRLDSATLSSLRRLAKEKGIGPTTLIRMWVMERLREERIEPSSKTASHAAWGPSSGAATGPGHAPTPHPNLLPQGEKGPPALFLSIQAPFR